MLMRPSERKKKLAVKRSKKLRLRMILRQPRKLSSRRRPTSPPSRKKKSLRKLLSVCRTLRSAGPAAFRFLKDASYVWLVKQPSSRMGKSRALWVRHSSRNIRVSKKDGGGRIKVLFGWGWGGLI